MLAEVNQIDLIYREGSSEKVLGQLKKKFSLESDYG